MVTPNTIMVEVKGVALGRSAKRDEEK